MVWSGLLLNYLQCNIFLTRHFHISKKEYIVDLNWVYFTKNKKPKVFLIDIHWVHSNEYHASINWIFLTNHPPNSPTKRELQIFSKHHWSLKFMVDFIYNFCTLILTKLVNVNNTETLAYSLMTHWSFGRNGI